MNIHPKNDSFELQTHHIQTNISLAKLETEYIIQNDSLHYGKYLSKKQLC